MAAAMVPPSFLTERIKARTRPCSPVRMVTSRLSLLSIFSRMTSPSTVICMAFPFPVFRRTAAHTKLSAVAQIIADLAGMFKLLPAILLVVSCLIHPQSLPIGIHKGLFPK